MKIFAYVLSVLAFVALAGIYGAACWLEYELWAIVVWGAMILAIPIASFVHELGHVIFGAVCGIKARPRFSLFGSSSCEIIPKKETNLRTRTLITSLGGILVNLFIAVVFLTLIGLDILPVWCSAIIPANMYLALLNTIPAQLYSGKTDGLVANNLIANTDEAKVILAVLTVQAQVLNGKPIEAVDEKLLFDVPQIQEDDQAFISLTELRYEYFNAKGENEQAEKYKARLEDLKQYLD